METIQIKTILELVSAKIWREKKYAEYRGARPDIPSLNERMLLVQELLPRAMFDGRIISFGKDNSGLHEVPFFNYLMLISDAVIADCLDGTSKTTDCTWSIIGFSSFKELDNFVQHQELLDEFYIYVRHRDYYKQAQYRMAFQRHGEEKTYTNEWGFYYPDDGPYGISSRNPDYKYFFEILGLCEVHCKDEIWCYIVGSLDDLIECLMGRAFLCENSWICELGKITDYHFKETGEIYYEWKDYTYCIEVHGQTTEWNIYDKDGNPYCSIQHAFCSPGRTCCGEIYDCHSTI